MCVHAEVNDSVGEKIRIIGGIPLNMGEQIESSSWVEEELALERSLTT